MPKTRLDIITMAHRRLAILSLGEVPSPDQTAYAGEVLDGIIEELNLTQHTLLSNQQFDDSIYLAMSYLLASEISQHYSVASEPRARAVLRLRAILFPDNRIDRRDLNTDGTVTEAEIDADGRSAYF